MSIRQYIQVKAAIPPDPAVYCPTNGYVYDPVVITPPIPIPTPPDESITLLCSNFLSNTIYCIGTGALTYTVYDSTGAVIFTQNKLSYTYFTYNYSVSAANPYYTIIATPQIANHILTFAIASHASYQYNQPIYAAWIKAPYMTSWQGMFTYLITLQACTILSTADNVTQMGSMFNASGILSFKFPSSMNALLTANLLFTSSMIKTVDFNNCSFPLLTNASEMFNGCKYFRSLDMTITAPKLVLMDKFCQLNTSLKTANMNFDVTNITQNIGMDNCFNSCTLLESVTLPNFSNSTYTITLSYFVNYCTALKYITYRGTLRVNSSIYSPIYKCPNIDTIRVKGDVVWISGSFALVDTGQYSQCPHVIFEKNINNVIMTTGCKDMQFLQDITNILNFQCSDGEFTSFNHPTMTFNRLVMGHRPGYKITNLNINWAGCVFPAGTSTVPIIYFGGSYTAADCNAIYSALPVASVPTYIDFRTCAGYSTSTKTIATAKNYLFL